MLGRIISEENGLLALEDVKKVASVITHELLLLASEAVQAVDSSKRVQFKRMAKLVAAAVGGAAPADAALMLTIGKRLDRQASTVRESVEHVSSFYAAELSRLQHAVHRAADPTTLLATLPADIDAIWYRSDELYNKEVTEIYFGYNELSIAATPSADAEAPSTRSSTLERREKSAEDARWEDVLGFPTDDYGFECYNKGYDAACARYRHDLEAAVSRMQGVGRLERRMEELDADRQRWAEERVEAQKKRRDAAEASNERLLDSCASLEDEVDRLNAELIASRAREEVLREVIRENCMRQ